MSTLDRARGCASPTRQVSQTKKTSSCAYKEPKTTSDIYEINPGARACMISFDEKTEPAPTGVVLQRVDSATVRLLWRGPSERRCFVACVEVSGDSEGVASRRHVHKLLHPRIASVANDEVYFEPARERERAFDVVIDYFSSAIKRSHSAASLLGHVGLLSHKKPPPQLGHSCSDLMPHEKKHPAWDPDGRLRYHHSAILSMDSARDARVWVRTCGKRTEFDSPWTAAVFFPGEHPESEAAMSPRVRVVCKTDKAMKHHLPARYRRIQVPSDMSMGALLCVYRKYLMIGQEKALFMFVREPGQKEHLRLVSNSRTVGSVLEDFHTLMRIGRDRKTVRVLDITLCVEDTFGCDGNAIPFT